MSAKKLTSVSPSRLGAPRGIVRTQPGTTPGACLPDTSLSRQVVGLLNHPQTHSSCLRARTVSNKGAYACLGVPLALYIAPRREGGRGGGGYLGGTTSAPREQCHGVNGDGSADCLVDLSPWKWACGTRFCVPTDVIVFFIIIILRLVRKSAPAKLLPFPPTCRMREECLPPAVPSLFLASYPAVLWRRVEA